MLILLLMLGVFGFVVWLITTYIPMPDVFKKAIIVIAVVLVIVYLVQVFGLDLPLPHAR